MAVHDTYENVKISLRYQSGISDEQAVAVAELLSEQLSLALSEPGLEISQVGSVSSGDKQQMATWSKRTPYNNACIHDVISSQARKQPTATAVHAWDGEFDYAELDTLSSRLACHLRMLGVGPEVSVPFCIEKSAWTIVILLGILKAGGAFVPLEPNDPIARKRRIISMVRASVLITSETYSHTFEGLVESVVDLDEKLKEKLGEATAHDTAPADVKPHNTAYIIFTSGSTGEPKGIIMEHGSFSTSVTEHGGTLGMDSNSRVLQFAAHVWDISLAEMMTPLVHGGCVCIPSDHDRMNNLIPAIEALRVNWAILTPTFARSIKPRDVPNLTTLVLAGEAIGQDTVQTWLPHVRLINGYGPAECCILSTVTGSWEQWMSHECIGRAVGGDCWVVHPQDINRLAPIGSIGEILIEGPCLAREYLGDPGQTASTFITDPKWSTPSPRPRRFYRTGDFGTQNRDGSISFKGRRDDQIKVRGQRLEVGETESRLMLCDLAQHVIVTLPATGAFQSQLVAVLTLEGSANGSVSTTIELVTTHDGKTVERLSTIKQYATQWLPAHGLPTVWLIIMEMPRTTSNKLDRGKVQRWIQNQRWDAQANCPGSAGSIDQPKTPMEIRLRDIWHEVLNVPAQQIGRESSFFRLGGDSISAIQVISALRVHGVSLSIQDLLRHKTVKEVALRATADVSGAPALQHPADVNEPFELSPIQKLHMNRCVTAREPFYQDFLLDIRSPISKDDLVAALHTVVDHHAMLRTRFERSDDGVWKQLISPHSAQAYRMCLHTLDGPDEDHIAKLAGETIASLDLRSGPVFGVDFIHLSSGEQILFLAAHHMVIDLLSWRILLRDLEDLLRGAKSLPVSTESFQAWTRLQAAHVLEAKLEPRASLPFNVPATDYKYWGMDEVPNLECDILFERFTLDQDCTAALLGSANDAYGSEPLDLLLASAIFSFAKIFDDRMVPAIFNESHGREPWDPSIDLTRTVGWFTTFHPIVVAPDGLRGIAEAVSTMKDTRRRIPSNGWAYFASGCLTREGADSMAEHLPSELQFNFAGLYQQLERSDSLLRRRAKRSADFKIAPSSLPRFSLLNIEAWVDNKSLTISVGYNKHTRHQDRLRQWTISMARTLKSISMEFPKTLPTLTLSDVPLLRATYHELHSITDELRKLGISQMGDIESIYPVSPMQEGLLLARMRQRNYYNCRFFARLTPSTAQPQSPIQVSSLSTAWQRLADRHAILRTVFIEASTKSGYFVQVVLRRSQVEVFFTSGRDNPEALRHLTEHDLMKQDISRPSHRLGISQSMEDGSVFCRLEISHALVDAASILMIWKDLCDAYADALPTQPAPTYESYIEYLQRKSTTSTLEYWKTYLEDADPGRFPVLVDKTADERADDLLPERIMVPFAEVSELRSFCTRSNLTPASVFQVAWALVLRSYTGNDSVCFGYLSSGRDLDIKDIQNIVGPLISMMILRVDLSDQTNLVGILEKAQRDYIDSLPHRASLAQVQRSIQAASLFNTAMSVQSQKSHQNSTESGSFEITPLPGEDPTEVYDSFR